MTPEQFAAAWEDALLGGILGVVLICLSLIIWAFLTAAQTDLHADDQLGEGGVRR